MKPNKSLKFVPAFGLHRTRLTPRRLAQTLAVCMRKSKPTPGEASGSVGISMGQRDLVPSGRSPGSSCIRLVKLAAFRTVSEVRGESTRRPGRFVLPGGNRVPRRASASIGTKLTPTGLPQLTTNSTGRRQSPAAAKPVWVRGGAG